MDACQNDSVLIMNADMYPFSSRKINLLLLFAAAPPVKKATAWCASVSASSYKKAHFLR